jgi:hypothetical protein
LGFVILLRFSWFFIPLIIILVLIFIFQGTATPVITCAPVRVEITDDRQTVWSNSEWRPAGAGFEAAQAAVVQSKPRNRTGNPAAPPFPLAEGGGVELTGLLISGGVKTLRVFGPGGKPELSFQLSRENSKTRQNMFIVSARFDQAAASEDVAARFDRIVIAFDRARCKNRS